VRVGDGDGLYGEQWNLSGDRRVSIVLRDLNPRPQADTPSNDTIGFFVAFSLLKKANNFITNFWHSGDTDFLPILQKLQNITIIYERNACQVRLKHTWLHVKVIIF
jgi:hypothetical protein